MSASRRRAIGGLRDGDHRIAPLNTLERASKAHLTSLKERGEIPWARIIRPAPPLDDPEEDGEFQAQLREIAGRKLAELAKPETE